MTIRGWSWLGLGVLILAGVLIWCSLPASFRCQGYSVTIAERVWCVMLADELDEWDRGSCDLRIPPRHGVFFRFMDQRCRGFWMKDCRDPLDLILFDETGCVVKIESMSTPFAVLDVYGDDTHCKYALQVPAGEARGVRVGDRMRFRGCVGSGCQLEDARRGRELSSED